MHQIIVGSIATNCWIYPLEPAGAGASPCVVIDPGEEGGRIIALLDQLKLFPQYIVLTHGHFDHIAALPALAARYGAGASPEGARPLIAIHAADAEYLGPNSYPVHCHSFSVGMGSSAFIDSLWEDMPSPDIILAEGDSIGPFTVLSLPGHTPGSIGLWEQNAGILFSGDTLFYGDYGRTDLPGGSEPLLFASLQRLFSLSGSIQVYPGHGPATSIEREAKALREILS